MKYISRFVLHMVVLMISTLILYSCEDKSADVKETITADIIIYGGTSAAITAAVEAKRSGKSVIVVSPDKHLGGLTSGGLGLSLIHI